MKDIWSFHSQIGRGQDKNSSVMCWGGLSKELEVKMSKECPKLTVMHNMSIIKKSNNLRYGWYW